MQEKCRRGADSEIALSILPKIERLLINKEAIKKTFCERGGRILTANSMSLQGGHSTCGSPCTQGAATKLRNVAVFLFSCGKFCSSCRPKNEGRRDATSLDKKPEAGGERPNVSIEKVRPIESKDSRCGSNI